MWRSLPLGKVANFVRLIQLGNKVESAPGIWVEFTFPWKTEVFKRTSPVQVIDCKTDNLQQFAERLLECTEGPEVVILKLPFGMLILSCLSRKKTRREYLTLLHPFLPQEFRQKPALEREPVFNHLKNFHPAVRKTLSLKARCPVSHCVRVARQEFSCTSHSSSATCKSPIFTSLIPCPAFLFSFVLMTSVPNVASLFLEFSCLREFPMHVY